MKLSISILLIITLNFVGFSQSSDEENISLNQDKNEDKVNLVCLLLQPLRLPFGSLRIDVELYAKNTVHSLVLSYTAMETFSLFRNDSTGEGHGSSLEGDRVSLYHKMYSEDLIKDFFPTNHRIYLAYGIVYQYSKIYDTSVYEVWKETEDEEGLKTFYKTYLNSNFTGKYHHLGHSVIVGIQGIEYYPFVYDVYVGYRNTYIIK